MTHSLIFIEIASANRIPGRRINGDVINKDVSARLFAVTPARTQEPAAG